MSIEYVHVFLLECNRPKGEARSVDLLGGSVFRSRSFNSKSYFISGVVGMLDYDTLIKTVEDYFRENGLGRSTDYYFGFFDCVSVLKAIRDEERMK